MKKLTIIITLILGSLILNAQEIKSDQLIGSWTMCYKCIKTKDTLNIESFIKDFRDTSCSNIPIQYFNDSTFNDGFKVEINGLEKDQSTGTWRLQNNTLIHDSRIHLSGSNYNIEFINSDLFYAVGSGERTRKCMKVITYFVKIK